MLQRRFCFNILSLLVVRTFGFVAPPTKPSTACGGSRTLPRTTRTVVTKNLKSGKSDDDNYDWLQSQRQGYQKLLVKIDTIEANIQHDNNNGTGEGEEGEEGQRLVLELQQLAVTQVEKELNQLSARLVPPVGLSMDEYVQTIRLILRLPPPIRLGLTKALELDDDMAGDVKRIPELATKLYEERVTLTPKRLVDSFKAATTTATTTNPRGVAQSRGGGTLNRKNSKQTADGTTNTLAGLMEKDPEASFLEASWKQLMSRVCRKKGLEPTASDVEILLAALDDSTFRRNGQAEPVPGGFVIRGQNRKPSGGKLIEALDAKLPQEWSCMVSYMPDITATESDSSSNNSNILVLLNKDFSPETSPWFYRLASVLATVSALLFATGVYGSNDVVSKQLMDMTSLNMDLSGFEWLNGKVSEVLLPLALILGSHELGHVFVAKRDKIETVSTFPTLLPMWTTLPLLGGLTRLRTSPPNIVSLFDFAVTGPLLGFFVSCLCFGFGLVLTQSALASGVANAAELLPALPVSLIKQSTLLGTIVDAFFGGQGYITLQDPLTPVPLHPYAIAGFCGVVLNAVEMLPLGSTDGGRMSQSLFGRQGHSIVGATTWTLLLLANFFLDGRGDTLITAWLIYNVVQNDMEIPARDETDDVDLPRSLTAFAMWFFTALVLIPME
jgi:membrane-associated protease RseP (regulator of RpoE activity)